MAARTGLSAREAQTLLDAWGLSLELLTPLPDKGTVNSNFRVRASGRDYFLRINEGKRESDALSEAQLVRWLRARGIFTPEILPTAEGGWLALHDGKPVTLFPWLPDATEARTDHRGMEMVGGALAQLHLAGADLVKEALPRNHYGLEELERRLATFEPDARLSEVVPILRQELDRAKRREVTLPSGLIHQDLFPDNVLVDGDGRLAAILDFEQATYGRFVYDLAVCVNAWCWDGSTIGDGGRVLLDAYRAIRPLSALEEAAFIDEARLAAARFTITRVTDVFLSDVDEALRRRKDYRDYVRRLEYWRAAR